MHFQLRVLRDLCTFQSVMGSAALLFLLFLVIPAAAQASTYFVDRSDDTSGGNCVFLTDNDCSLRSAIDLANGSVGHDSIIFIDNLDPITLTGAPGENLNASGDLDITQPLTITGRGVDETTITTISEDHVFEVDGASLTLHDMRITLGSAITGGCISAYGYTPAHELLLDSVIVSGCTASSSGGALRIDSEDSDFPGHLSIRDSLFENNVVLGNSTQGGALLLSGTAATIDRTTFNTNAQRLTGSGPGYGGAIQAYGSGLPLVIRNSTFYGNHSTGFGGAISSGMATTIQSSTFVANRSDEDNDTDGISTYSGAAPEVGNSIFSGNTTGGGSVPDACGGSAFTDLGNNLVSSSQFASTCGLTGASNIVDTGFGAPAPVSLGGTRLVIPITAASRAVDAGSAALCGALATDAVGNARSVGVCDIGAFELQDQADLSAVSVSFGASSIRAGSATSLTGQVSNSGPSTAGSTVVTMTVPAGLSVSEASIDGVACTGTTTLTCSIASFPTGSNKTVTATVKGVSAGISSVGMSISTPGIDRNQANNSTTGSVTVTAAPVVARPSLVVRGRSFKMTKSGRTVLPARCDGAAGARCQVALNLTTTKRFAGKRKWRIVCAAVNPVVGQSVQVKCKLPAKFRKGVKSRKSVKVKLVGTVKVGTDRRAISPVMLTLKR